MESEIKTDDQYDRGRKTITTINNKYNLITGYPGKKKQKDFGRFFNVEFVDASIVIGWQVKEDEVGGLGRISLMDNDTIWT